MESHQRLRAQTPDNVPTAEPAAPGPPLGEAALAKPMPAPPPPPAPAPVFKAAVAPAEETSSPEWQWHMPTLLTACAIIGIWALLLQVMVPTPTRIPDWSPERGLTKNVGDKAR